MREYFRKPQPYSSITPYQAYLFLLEDMGNKWASKRVINFSNFEDRIRNFTEYFFGGNIVDL